MKLYRTRVFVTQIDENGFRAMVPSMMDNRVHQLALSLLPETVLTAVKAHMAVNGTPMRLYAMVSLNALRTQAVIFEDFALEGP
jgi:hypothetical protein